MTQDLFAPKRHAPVIHHGDCLTVLRTMPDASVDAVVTDPPYLIDFMGKGWDSADGIAGKPEIWAECLRVLKPGGHLLAFGATRTYHRMACAIEDAGFEIRDSIHWMYGSGFPKSLDVAKAITATETTGSSSMQALRKARMGADYEPTLQEDPNGDTYDKKKLGRDDDGRETPLTDLAKQWAGWGTALKPSHEPVVVARKPLAGTVAANVERYGTGALNIDASRVGTTVETRPATKSYGAGAMHPGGKGTTQKTGPVPPGRWPPNIVLSHAEDCTENACDETCAVAELDKQSGITKSTGGAGAASRGTMGKRVLGTYALDRNGQNAGGLGDTGGASRFFPVFRYQAKASRSERETGCESLPAKTGAEAVDREEGSAGTQSPRAGAGRTATEVRNGHPTVKPIALMEWLVTLVTPPGGVVLDPFMGSGTTGVAAVRKGFRFVGIEREDEYLAIARARIEAA